MRDFLRRIPIERPQTSLLLLETLFDAGGVQRLSSTPRPHCEQNWDRASTGGPRCGIEYQLSISRNGTYSLLGELQTYWICLVDTVWYRILFKGLSLRLLVADILPNDWATDISSSLLFPSS
jgi:hypothetical protein